MGRTSLSGLRILHVHTLPVVSGSGLNTLLTMYGSRDCGAQVALACAPGGKLEELVRSGNMDLYPIHHFVSEISPWKDLYALWQLGRLFKKERFDIVHTHNSKAGFLGRLSARRHRIPIIIHTIHGFAFHDQESWFLRRLFVRLERVAARWCHHLIAISQPMIDWAAEEKIATLEKIDKIYSGIQIEKFRGRAPSSELRTRYGVQPGEVVVGIVAKLWEGKGHELLIEAVARLLSKGHNVRLLVVGEGVLEGTLKKKVLDLGIQGSVVFTGFLSDVPGITAILDISALPSFYEGMGRVVLEAMAAGKPVVASRVGGLTELVEDEKTGYLVPAGDVGALTVRLEALVSNASLRREMGEAGARRIGEQYSSDRMVEMIHQVYKRYLPRLESEASASISRRAVGRTG